MTTPKRSENGAPSRMAMMPSAPSVGQSNTTDPVGDESGPSAASKPSALSTKITSILSTSYGDLDIRDALATLDARGLKNTAYTRRNLRLDVQKEIIDCNTEIVKDFSQVAAQLRSVGTALENLQRTCAEMRKHVSYARVETAPMMEEASMLVAQKNRAEAKQAILKAFTGHFLLSEDELRVLTSGAEPVTDEFFQLLVKAKRIRKDCQVLLSTENQRLGLEIMDQSTKNLNAAFQKLFRWVQRELKALNLENAQMNRSMRRGIRVLAERPTLFQSCLDTFAESRERALSDAFYTALVRGQDQQKPIEFSAHEPLRYAGDMLAWAHATTVSERELLEGLFVADGEDEIARGIQEGLESEPWSRQDSSEEGQVVFDGKKALSQLVNASLAGVAQLLRQRIEQVVQSYEEPVLAYKIANLCVFYCNIFKKLFLDQSNSSSGGSGFLETLQGLEARALEQFQSLMRHHVQNVKTEPSTVPNDLSSPEFLQSALEELAALLKSYDTSTVSSSSSDDSALVLLFGEALDPFLEACGTLADAQAVPSGTIFLSNCLLSAQETLARFPHFAGGKLAEIESMQTKQHERLLEFSHQHLLKVSGVQALLAAVQTTENVAKLSSLPQFSEERLAEASQELDEFLASALIDATEELHGLRTANLARSITTEAAERFCLDFERLVDALNRADDFTLAKQSQGGGGGIAAAGASNDNDDDDDKPGDEPPHLLRDLYPRNVDEVRILLS